MSEREACDWPREYHVVMMAQDPILLDLLGAHCFRLKPR